MKTNIKLHQHIVLTRTILLALFIGLSFSCKDDEYLNEVPLDFYAPETSYISYEKFKASL
jgi:hypothetical protein